MECKYLKNILQKQVLAELIDTLWNVNVFSEFAPSRLRCELIDTLWNVNTHLKLIQIKVFSELIDTLWNVNINNFQ